MDGEQMDGRINQLESFTIINAPVSKIASKPVSQSTSFLTS